MTPSAFTPIEPVEPRIMTRRSSACAGGVPGAGTESRSSILTFIRSSFHESPVIIIERRRQKKGIKPVEHAAMARQQLSAVLRAGAALEHRFPQIRRKGQNSRDKRQS